MAVKLAAGNAAVHYARRLIDGEVRVARTPPSVPPGLLAPRGPAGGRERPLLRFLSKTPLMSPSPSCIRRHFSFSAATVFTRPRSIAAAARLTA